MSMRIASFVAVSLAFVQAQPSIESVGQEIRFQADTIRFSTKGNVDLQIADMLVALRVQDEIQANVLALNLSLASEIADVATKTNEVDVKFQGLVDGLDSRLSTVETKIEAIATLQSRLTNLESYVKAIPTSAPTCDELTISNGVVDAFGDHGKDVPVSVTVSFSCNKGYYLSGSNVSTCQSSGWSNEASTCKTCPSQCSACNSQNECTECKKPLENYVANGQCIAGREGFIKVRPGKSCLALYTKDKNLNNGFYWLVDQDTGKPQQFECDMDNGGFTLVGVGIGGDIGCWQTSGSASCLPNTYPESPTTFKFSDKTIAAFQTSVFKFAANGSQFTGDAWYWKGDDKSKCRYQHNLPSSNDCNCAYENEDFSDTCNENNIVVTRHMGLGDWGNGQSCLHTNQRTNNKGWYFRANGVTNCGSVCRGEQTNCDIQLYVK